jgi:hypothetical protein
MEPVTLTLLASKVFRDAVTRTVFEAVAKPRTILVRDLKNNVTQEDTNLSNEDLEHSITVLKDADLIRERPAVISDFSTLYLTRNGFDAANALKDPSLMSRFETQI